MGHRYMTRNWSATDTGFLQQEGEINEITVTGEVQTLNTGEHPTLKELPSHGMRSTLVLELDVPSSPGPVGDIVEWKPIRFNKQLRGTPKINEVEIKGNVVRDLTIHVHALQG